MRAASESLAGSLTANEEAVEELLSAAAAGQAGALQGQDVLGAWTVSARPSGSGDVIVQFEIANNATVWGGTLEDVDGNLTLWGEFQFSGDVAAAVEKLMDVEAEAHRLAELIGAEERS